MVVCSLEEVTYWAKKGCLGSDSDPMEPGVTNLIVAFSHSPWPCTLSLARVHVAPNQKMCSIIEAVESAKEHFNGEKGLKAAHYYLTPVYTEAPYILSDAGLQAADGSATIIGVATVGVVPKDNSQPDHLRGGSIYFGDTLPPSSYNEPHFGSSSALLSCMDWDEEGEGLG